MRTSSSKPCINSLVPSLPLLPSCRSLPMASDSPPFLYPPESRKKKKPPHGGPFSLSSMSKCFLTMKHSRATTGVNVYLSPGAFSIRGRLRKRDAHRLKLCIHLLPACRDTADKSASYRLNDWICQYDCVHTESLHPHFHCVPVHEQIYARL